MPLLTAEVDQARAIVLVEGTSDQVALESAAKRLGRDLDAERVVVLAMGGAHAISRFLTELRRQGTTAQLAGLCDLHEEEFFRRALVGTHVPAPRTRADMERLGFFVCLDDLEDELIRAVGAPGVEALFDTQGDLTSFRSLQGQPTWRGRPREAQMHRFLGSGSGRKLRYARLLAEEAVNREALPRPLDGLLSAVGATARSCAG